MRWILVLLPFALFGQTQIEQPQVENLEQLRSRLQQDFFQSNQRVQSYIQLNKVPVFQRLEDGTEMQLIDVDEFGLPVYLKTLNADLAVSTGVTQLRVGGSLNLNLRGAGLAVGVWDSGPVFEHNEFGNRILSREGGTSSDHGTHVAGTILAAGLNPMAMGMAPEASLYSYDWTNDRAEMAAMAKPDQTGLLFSNHSYGIVQGWNCQNNSCQWMGTPGISDREDWRFGFYTTLARDYDQIAFNAPYYSIFWAAGNDRDDFSNTGIYPQDGNQGSGYDCIGQEGTAKNIFTIGAVRKVTNYQGPESVEMSSFSGWGPTDDGRIKPDLVDPGVSIFSTVTDNGYASFNGTSMATPGALGSLSLLQELHADLNNGEVMRSATLKALAIHTAKEAGLHPGPDYSFGWGLIDVEAGAKVLLGENNLDTLIQELTLNQGQVMELTLLPEEKTKVTVTIVWTDPAGTVVASSLDPTNLMLVNDLDVRLVDDANQQQFPWVLNPDINALGEAAFKSDNFRDNVEKLEFENPEPRPYKLRISHKGTLTGGVQNFSLVITYTKAASQLPTLYWIGGTGNFNDPDHWSLTSGGVTAGVIPTAANRVVVDENSQLNAGEVILISEDREVGSFTWLEKNNAVLSLQGHTLSIAGSLNFGSGLGSLSTGGKVKLMGSLAESNLVVTNNSDFSPIDLEIDSDNEYEIKGGVILNSLSLKRGEIILDGILSIGTIQVINGNPIDMDISNAIVNELETLDLSASTLSLKSLGAQIEPAQNAQLDFGNKVYEGKLAITNTGVVIRGNNELSVVEVQGGVKFDGSNLINQLVVKGGAELSFSSGTSQTLSESVQVLSDAANRSVLKGDGGKATLIFDGRFKLCFDFLDISSVDASGDAVINAGLSSTLSNSENWAKDECEDILFPDFEIRNNCAFGIVELIDKSGGDIDAWKWTAGGANTSLYKDEEQNAMVVFSTSGPQTIQLTISNDNDERSLLQTLEVMPNDLLANTVVLNGLNLFSSQASTTYQWYRDLEPIAGATGRSYPFNGEPGLYFVLTFNSTCNRISNSVVITDVNDENAKSTQTIEIYPNPASDKLIFRNVTEPSVVQFVNLAGAVIKEQKIQEEGDVIPIDLMARGMYVVTIRNSRGVQKIKLILN